MDSDKRSEAQKGLQSDIAKLHSYMARHNVEVENSQNITALIEGISRQVANEYIELTPELIDLLISIQERLDAAEN